MEKSPVEPLLEEVEPSFTKDILKALLPAKFKKPQIKLYGEERDLIEYLKNFRSWMKLQGAIRAAMCRAFSLMLTRAACKWYRKLKPGPISSFT